jgi:ketosteroid isomerase-like protein
MKSVPQFEMTLSRHERIRSFNLKIVTVLICIGGSFAGGGSIAASQSGAVEVVRHKFAAFNQHDLGAIEHIYSSNATLNSPDQRGLIGNKPIADTYRMLFESIPDAKDTIELLEAAGKRVYAQFVLSGHWNGMQDKPVKVRIMSVYTVKNGRIIDDATYYDRK